MAEEYKVDLDALDQVVKELNAVLGEMGGPGGPCTKTYEATYLPPKALGSGFSEQQELHDAHTKMKSYIETHIVDLIRDLIDDFGSKSKKVKETYDDSEKVNTKETSLK
ncbi:hypothetical protein ABZW18_20460 [Streptomyces sp. NPDC004647]|uniref:hypothetical protein n=1 Tax=Streptomyces sp. NPDC004647 TaxID=3154671 RepID=UPI00339F003C